MTDTLNLFPARIAIGKWRDPNTGKDIPVMMSPEFERALASLFRRVGGPVSMSLDDVIALSSVKDISAPGLIADRRVAELEQQVAALQSQISQFSTLATSLANLERSIQSDQHAAVVELKKRIASDEIMVTPSYAYFDWTRPGKIGSSTPNTGAFTSISYSLQLTSTVATGTAPMVVSSTTKVANLNADLLDGSDWSAPPAIGSVTPNGAAFTQVVTTGALDNFFGTNSSTGKNIFNGSNSGAGGGTYVTIQNSSTSIIAIGNKSALLGGAYDATPMIYSNATLHTFTHMQVNGDLTVTGKAGFNGAAAQSAAASGGSVATTAATNAAPFGYTTAAQADGIRILLNNIRAALVANGIMS